MANVKVAVRVRPLSKRETKEGGRIIVEVDDKVAKIRNLKVASRPDGFGDSREKVVAFGFDYCYWSVNPEDPQYASQDMVFQDLGTEVLSGAAKGYNICLFAYGQTGSGKTYTMLGTPASVGLTPRICEGLFIREEDCASLHSSCKIQVSFLEIYNERVRDLLKQSDKKKSYTLRVREHPEMGPYVQGLSHHVVTSYKQVIQLLEEGIANRMTAATHVHEASSRSHAIFTIHYTKAILENNLPSETASKINLVDLAGSERADPSYCKDRIAEGANINKSLVTLGIVISTLAQNSQKFSSCQSLNNAASSGGDSRIPSSPGTSSGGALPRRQSYIPYRDSVLTWLLKDSLGGNSKTIMVATVSPAHTCYNETMSTLRYASNAKNIVNKPQVNEDANVKLIRELREEIERLKAMLLSFELRNFSSLNDGKDENLKELVLQNELKIDKLTKDWTQKWSDWRMVMEYYSVDINKRRAGVVIDSSLPHLLVLEDDVLSTGVVLYHLKEGKTKIGRIDSDQEQDIVLQGQWIERDHCTITSACGVVILQPTQGARCTVNGHEVTTSCRLTQGAVITLGKAQKFRFNHPAEAALLRQRRQIGEAVGSGGSLEWLDLARNVTASRQSLCPVVWKERRVLEEQCDKDLQPPRDGETSHRAQIQQQRCCVEDLRQQILRGQIRAEKELEFHQARICQQIKDNHQWLLREETWLARLQEQQQEDDRGEGKELEASVAPDAWLQTDLEPLPSRLVQSQKRVVQLQLLRRHALRAAERHIRQKKVLFQLERIIKKQRLLEAKRRLEQLRALCWLQDGSAPRTPCQVPSSNAAGPGPQHRSKWTSCSSSSLQRLCSKHLPQLHSVLLNSDPSTMLPPMPDLTHQVPEKTPSADPVYRPASYTLRTGHLCRNSLRLQSSGQGQLCPARGASTRKAACTPGTCHTVSNHESVDSQKMQTRGMQPCQVVSQGLVSMYQLVNKLKPRDGPRTLAPTTQTRRIMGLAAYGNTQTGWRKEWNLGIHKVAKRASCHSLCSHGPKQAARCGKAAFQAESKPPPSSRALKRHQKALAVRVRDIAKFSHGSSLKRQHSLGDPVAMTSLTDFSPVVVSAREKDNDLSDTGSNYSVDSLSHVYAEVPMEPPKSENLQGKWGLTELENSESDNSQISEDSLADKGYQSPKERVGGIYPINNQGHPRNRTTAPVRGFTTLSDSDPHAHRTFSLDSLVGAEEEVGEDQQEETFLGSADELPAEAFWRHPSSNLPVTDQEAKCRPGPIHHTTEARLNAILPVSSSSSFYLSPHSQPHCEHSELEAATCYSGQASSLQGLQLSQESPLLSTDSWFSCDSKINPSPPGITGSLCPSPDVQEVHSCGEERPGYRLNVEELKPPGAETVLPHCSKLPRASMEPPCYAKDVYTASASDTSKLSVCGVQRLLYPGAHGIFQGRGIPDLTQEGSSEVYHYSGIPSVLAASATSFTHVGSIHGRDWTALQQKYLLELSHPVLEVVGEPRPASPCLEEDSSSMAKAPGKERNTQLPVDPRVSSNVDFNNSPVHLSKIRHLRAEKNQDSSSTKFESASDFISTSEKEASYSGAYSADIESLASESTNVQIYAVENKVPDSVIEACEVKPEECFQGNRKPGLMTSSDECFLQNNACYKNVTIATKASQAPLGKNSAVQPGQSSHSSHYPLQEEKEDHQESSKEVVGRHTNVSFAYASGPELYLHSAPWNSLPSSLQPPPLETFYVTKSRDALTETALEIPACREIRVPSPPPREAWGFGHTFQVLEQAYLKSNLSDLSQSQKSKIASSQQVTAERPVDLGMRKAIGEPGECLGNIKEENHKSIYFFAQNSQFLPSASTNVGEFESQVGILNKKPGCLACTEGEMAAARSHCSVSLDSSGSGKSIFYICDSEAGGKEEQDQNAVLPQIQACNTERHLPSGARADFICKTNLGLEKDLTGKTADSLKSRSAYLRVSRPVIRAESPTHKWQRKNEAKLLGESLHPKVSPEEFKFPGTESACERLQSITCAQERNPSECKGAGGSQEMINSKKEPLEKKQKKRVNNADEMAKLMKSVMQLENGILEIESEQNKWLHASHTQGVSKEFVFQDQKDQERVGHILRTGSSGNHSSFKDQLSSPRQTDYVIFCDGETGKMEVHSPQVQKSTKSPLIAWECAQEGQSLRDHAHSAELDRPSSDTRDSLGNDSAHTSLHPRKMKTLARTLLLQSRPEGSSEKDGNLAKASANQKEQPWALGSLEEIETIKNFQESQATEHMSSISEQEDPAAQGRVEEMAMQRGGSLQEENNTALLTDWSSGQSQQNVGTFFSQEASSPLLNQTDSSSATSHQDLNSSLPSVSPRLPRNCLHAFDTIDISSVDCDPTVLKIRNSPLVSGVECQDESPQGRVGGGSSTVHTVWCESVMPMGSDVQSVIPKSIPVGTVDWITASTSPHDQGEDLRITSMGLNTPEGFDSEAEVAVQKEVSTHSLTRVSGQLEKKVSFLLEEDIDRGKEISQEEEEEAEDQQPTSSTCLALVSLPRVPDAETMLSQSSLHASMCLAILQEIRQATAQRKQLTDFVTEGTAYCETSLKPECFLGATGRPQWQMDQLEVSDRPRNEGGAQGSHEPSLSASRHLLVDERRPQATPVCADSFRPLPHPETDKGPWHPSQASSHTASDQDKRPYSGELRHLMEASEQFVGQSSSEVTEIKKETPRIPSSADTLTSDRPLSSPVVEGDRRTGLEKVVSALPSQTPCYDPEGVLFGQSQVATWGKTMEDMSPGSQYSSLRHQEFKNLDTMYGGGSGNFLVTAQGGKTTHFESQSVICVVHNSASLSRPKEDHVYCPEASTGLEDGRSSPKQHAILAGAPRKVDLEVPTWQHVKWKESIGSGLAEACRTSSKTPRPTPLPKQRPSSDPRGVMEEAPCQHPKEALDYLIFSGNTETSRPFGSSRREEDSRSLPCQQLCNYQPIATHPSTLLCYRDGELRNGTSKVDPPHYSPFIVPSRACEMDEIGESPSTERHLLLAHGLEHKGVHVELEPMSSSHTLEPPTGVAALSLAGGCSSPSTPGVRTSFLTHSAADRSLRSVRSPEKKVTEKASTELEAVLFPEVMISEPLRTSKDCSVGGQSAPASQTKPEPPATTKGPRSLNLREGSVESELVAETQHRYLENAIRHLSKKTQPSTESTGHSCSDSKARFLARLKRVCSPQPDNSWEEEEEEQQKDQTLGGDEAPAQGSNPPPSDEEDLDGCQMSGAREGEVAVTKSPGSQTFFSGFKDPAPVSLEQSEAPQPAAQRPGQPCSDREQPAPHQRCCLPVIAIFSGSKPSKSSPRPQFSVVSSSRSLKELNLSVEPPPSTDEDAQGPNRLWSPHLRDCSGKSVARTCLRSEDCNQKSSSNLDTSPADYRPLKPATPPYPTSPALSCMPTPDFMTSWISGTLEQAQQRKPEKLGVQVRPDHWCSQLDKGMLHIGSSDINPYVLPWSPAGSSCIGWKQYVFGSAVDVSWSQKHHGLIPSNVAQCSSMDHCLEGQNSAFHSHLSIYAKTRDLSNTRSSIENARSSNEAGEVWHSSFALREPHILTGPQGVDPTSGTDRRPHFQDPSDEASCTKSELPLAEGSSAGPVDEIVLLYPSEAGCRMEQARINTLEQGTQTLGTDVSAQPVSSVVSACDLAAWTSMHNLSLHLSQLLHSTSELLGTLSQPSVVQKEENTKSDTSDEAAQALRMDGATQTTVDEGSQTDLASALLPLHVPEIKPQEVNVILEVLGSGIEPLSLEKDHVPEALQKREAEESAQKMTLPPDLHEESTPCGLQSPPTPSSHLRVEKARLGQSIPSESPPASPDATLPPSSQPEQSSCMVVNNPSIPHSPGLFFDTSESTWDPGIQKKLGPLGALLVDRASSPILTLRAGTQESGPPLHAWIPSALPLEDHPKLDFSLDLALRAPKPPMDSYSQSIDVSCGSQKVESGGRGGVSPLERSAESLLLEASSPCTPLQSTRIQVSFSGESPQQLQPRTATRVQKRLPPPPLRHRSLRLADSFVPEVAASSEHGSLSSRGPSRWQGRLESGSESVASMVEPQTTLDLSSSWRGLQPLSPCSVSHLADTAGLRASTLGPPEAGQLEGLLCPSSPVCMAPEPQHHSLRDLPLHNKFSNWGGVHDGSPGGLGVSKDLNAGEQRQRPPQPPNNLDPEWSRREQIPLHVGVQKPSLSIELTEAKLHRGFGEADALLQVLQTGMGEALAPDEPEPVTFTWKELYSRQKKTIETLRRERAEQFQNIRRTRSLSPQKQQSFLFNRDLPNRELDLPSRRREYLQQLRKDVVETTRSPESPLRSVHASSDIDLMLRDYQRAREETKVEIARARERLRERTEQEKLRIRQQITTQLLREEEKLHSLVNSSSLCSSSNGSLSSGVTSGYNSSPALSGQLPSPEGVGDSNSSDPRDTWIGDGRSRSAVRNSHLYVAGTVWRSSAYSYRASLGSCCSPSSLSSLGTCFSSSYQDLAKHIVDTTMADVMAACSENLHNLFTRQPAAGWNYQGEEQEVQLYYKEFSSTRHGFLGAGVVSQPLSHVWAAVSDPTLWPLYHKPIQTARLHQRVTNSISLVYLVCDTTLCAMKQPRDFCCVCVEAKEVPTVLVGQLSVMAAQSVYDTSMPRPSRNMVRGEILPSAWILQPVTIEGKEITRVIFLAQVELGAPGFPPHLLSSFVKQQPLVVAKLASFLGS
ncbi:stAR-related lipid transfer protein 9 isoform X3 [Castor canadensis]|uniref:StAR-related lipid transfer protein 9 isoform X3 n=2 Tax=Castor canadensis TaxID=51338 RepID=A0AC58LXH5_CASCN